MSGPYAGINEAGPLGMVEQEPEDGRPLSGSRVTLGQGHLGEEDWLDHLQNLSTVLD